MCDTGIKKKETKREKTLSPKWASDPITKSTLWNSESNQNVAGLPWRVRPIPTHPSLK